MHPAPLSDRHRTEAADPGLPFYVAAESYKFARKFPLNQQDIQEPRSQQKPWKAIRDASEPIPDGVQVNTISPVLESPMELCVSGRQPFSGLYPSVVHHSSLLGLRYSDTGCGVRRIDQALLLVYYMSSRLCMRGCNGQLV